MTSMRSKAVSWILILAMVFTTVFGNAAMVFADTPEPSESTYAAMIGETGYEDLQEAIDAADGKTVTLEKDVTVTEGIHVPAGTTMTLDLNGFTVSQEKACTEHYVMITNNGNLTITGEGAISFKDTGAGDPKHGWGSYTVGNYGTLIVENGTIEHLGEQEFAKHMICAIQQFDGTVTINDGTISTPNYRSVRVNKGNLILNGGEFDGQVWIQPNQGDATITVTGGTFGPNDGDGSSIFMTNVGEKYTVTSAEISGGTFTTKIGCSNPDALAGSITGGTFSQSAMDYTNSVLLAEGKTFVDGKLQDAELPNAEVINLGKKHVDSKDFVDGYIIYNLMNQSIVDFDAVDPFDLQIAMQFLAKDSVEQAAANYYGQYITDFYLTFDGMKEDSFVADGCYLAGYYPSFGAWVKIPMDGFRVENGTVYPVITGAGFEFTYEMICDGVKDFTCGLFLSDEVLKANPDLKVKLELGLSKDVNAALNGVYKTVDKPYVYTVEDMKGSVIADSTVIDSIADKNTGVDRGDVADIVEDIANNVALKDYTPDNLQNANTIDIVLVDMDVNVADGEEATPTKITYDVTPKDENGTAIENFDNKVTFRLPVPSSVAENQAKVYHKGDLMGIYTIQGSDNAKYVEVSSANFSEYTVEPVSNVKIVAAVGGVGFDSFADALDAAEVGDTVKVMTDIEPTTSIKIATDKNITLDLNGHVIAGTDTATGSFGLINVDPGAVLTVTDSSESKDGKITLTAKNDRDWNAYSSVISNQRGKVVVEGGTIEHLGGTDMAYGIDNLTNGKGTYAETIINGGTVKSTYRAIRQFLNGVEAQNILTINGGTIEGANKSVWMQDSSANANSGTLTIGEEATLKGDVYLFVTAGSTEWPVTVTIAKEALDEDSKVSTGNVPAGYELKETENGFGVVETFEAMIDDDKYPTLKDAFDAVEDGDTVKLLTDVSIDTETYTIKDGVSVTLDMNGKKLTVTDNKETVNYELFYVYGEMTVTGNGAIELTAMHDRDWNAMSAIFHNRGGVLNIENGTFKHLGGSDMAYVVDNSGNYYGDATTNINDGTLDSTYIAIRNRMEQNSHGASGKAILNVYGGTITGPRRAIWAQAASTSTTSPATGEINITGGEIGLIETDCSAGAESMTTISGGTVDAVKCEVGELAVTGGTVGTVTTLTTSGEEVEYTVTDEGQYVTAIAKIGDVKYASLQEAIDAAEDGDTIVLLNDVTEDVTVTQSPDVKITIDGNGKTMNGAITVDGKSKGYETAGVTIKNVNFDATGISTDACINLGVSGNTNTRYTNNVTVEDCTFKGAGQAKVAIKSYTGGDRNFTATGCTVESTMHSFLQLKGVDGVMIDECTVNSKNGINLNNSENAVIQNSKVEVSGYAVRMGESTGGGSGKVELTNNVLKTDNTEDPVIEIRGEAATELDLTMSENVVSGNTHFKGTTDATKIDANANYWGENLSAPVVADGSTAVKVVNYYEDEALTKLIVSDLAGEGTEANPYLINTLDELKWFRDDVNAGNTYSKKFVKLGADIDLGSEEWTPIGIQGKAFNGVFDGNNKKISNLMITGYNSEVGLFGRTNTGEIKNLTIENAKVSGRLKVGVVAGTPYTSKYTNIKVTGHVEVNGMSYVGGVGGKDAYANWTDITVNVDESSYVKAVSTENGLAYRTYVGGVIGFIGEGGHTFKNITSNIAVIGDVCDVGGIAGIAHYGNNFENVTCTATVENTNPDPADNRETGGIAGVWHNQSGQKVTFVDCEFDGTVLAGEEDITATNGVVGTPYNPSNAGETSGQLVIDKETVWPVVAQIGDQKFSKLQDAIDAAQTEDTVTVMADTDLKASLVIASDDEITLDLNGKTITGVDTTKVNYGLINVNPGGALTVTDSSENKDGKIALTATNNRGWNSYSSVISNQRGTVVIEAGTIEHLGGTDMAYGIDTLTNGKGTYAETIINGGTVKSTYRAIRQFLNGVEADNILTINGGTIEGANKSVWMQDPNKNANSGTLTISENAVLKGDVYLFVTEGSTEWPVEVSIAKAALFGESKVVSGNVPAGYAVKETEEGYGVVETFEAMIGDVKYPTLKDAYDAANSGDTIILIRDVKGPGLVINKDIEIDFNGCTYSFTDGVGSPGTETNGFQILEGNTVKLMYGTLNVAEGYEDQLAILVQNYADLEVLEMTLDGTGLDCTNTSYTLSNNSGEVNIWGETNIIANDEGNAFAFDSCTFGNYEPPYVVVDTTGLIDGAIEVSAGIAIFGGTFTHPVDQDWCVPGYMVVENEDGTYGVKEDDACPVITGVEDGKTYNGTVELKVVEPNLDNLEVWLDDNRILSTNDISEAFSFYEPGVYTVYAIDTKGNATELTFTIEAEHSYDNEVVTAPTCTTAGYTTYACDCGASYKDDIVEALGHDWNEGEVTTEPTCTKEGVKTFTCQNDATHTKTEAVAKIAHVHKNVVKEATCDADGYVALVCDCGDTYATITLKATGHAWDAGKVTTEPTCTKEGVKTFTCQNDATHTRTEAVAKAAHVYKEAVTAPTCETAGYTTYTCQCGDTYKDKVVEATGHKWDAGKVTTEPTCTKEGVKTFTCQNDATHTRTEAVAKAAHVYKEAVTAPTCETAGYTTYTCQCGDTYKDKVVEATGHKWDAGKVTTEPTCTKEGVKTFTCQNDATHTRTEAVAKVAHVYKATVTAPTCTTEGTVTLACVCGDTFAVSTIAPVGHKPGAAATCTTAQNCTVCGTELEPAKGHAVAHTEKTRATMEENGKIVKTCVCGKTMSTETIYKVKSMTLSKSNVVYTGKKFNPTLTIKDTQGNKLKKGTDYTVSIPKYRKNVGKYRYKITFKGNYVGTAYTYLTIKSKAPSIKKPTAAKNAVTAKWNKVPTQVTGYEVMVATDKKFTKNKMTIKVKGYKTVSKKVTNLKSNKTYYVKVRAYKTVKVTGAGIKNTKATVYSNWSAVKSVKIK